MRIPAPSQSVFNKTVSSNKKSATGSTKTVAKTATKRRSTSTVIPVQGRRRVATARSSVRTATVQHEARRQQYNGPAHPAATSRAALLEAIRFVPELVTFFTAHIDHEWEQIDRCVYCVPCRTRLYQGTVVPL